MKIATDRPIPYITAHAGCMDTMPNSRESILTAFRSEADIVEVDLRATSDLVVILSHDDTLQTSRGKPLELKQLTWEEIAAHNSVSDTPILNLDDFFDLAAEFGGKKSLNLDIKNLSALHVAAAKVKARGLDESVIFSGLYEEGIRAAKLSIPDMAYFFNADEMLPRGAFAASNMDAACSLAIGQGCRGLNLEWTRASASFVEYARKRGLLMMLWTVDTETEMQTALSYRPDSLTTNYPDLLSRLIRRQ